MGIHPASGLVIDVIDMEDATLGGNRQQWLSYLGASSSRIEMYGMSNGVGQMVTDIIRALGPSSLDRLRIWGHGWSGGQIVSAGGSANAAVQHWAGLTVQNLVAMRPTLLRLSPYFSSHAHVELRGCSVGQGASGERLLEGLASIWGVPVQAGTVVQSTGRWAGTVVQATPSGALTCETATPVGTRP